MSSNQLKLTLVKSLIGRLPKHKEIVRLLGLTKMHQTVTHNDNPSIRGMVNTVSYLLKVEEN